MNKKQICDILFNDNKDKYVIIKYDDLFNILSNIEKTNSEWETLREYSTKHKIHQKNLNPGYYCTDCGGYSPVKTKYCPHCGLHKENYNV